jgi:hypothetical protein
LPLITAHVACGLLGGVNPCGERSALFNVSGDKFAPPAFVFAENSRIAANAGRAVASSPELQQRQSFAVVASAGAGDLVHLDPRVAPQKIDAVCEYPVALNKATFPVHGAKIRSAKSAASASTTQTSIRCAVLSVHIGPIQPKIVTPRNTNPAASGRLLHALEEPMETIVRKVGGFIVAAYKAFKRVFR